MQHIHTDNPQTVITLPRNWRNIENWGINATPEQRLAAGFRPYTPATAPEGERITEAHIEHDATEAWQVIDATVNIAAEQAADEAAHQAAKSDALKAVENRFISFCEQLTGQRVKAGFGSLRAVIESMAANPDTTAQALVIAAQLTAINDEGFREGGLHWWDDCVWHEEVAQ